MALLSASRGFGSCWSPSSGSEVSLEATSPSGPQAVSPLAAVGALWPASEGDGGGVVADGISWAERGLAWGQVSAHTERPPGSSPVAQAHFFPSP